MMYGCIPVTFNSQTAVSMYPWHWTEAFWKEVAVEIPTNISNIDNMLNGVDPVEYLSGLLHFDPAAVKLKQLKLRRRVFELHYALETHSPDSSSGSWPLDEATGAPMRDAYMISMDLVLASHSGRRVPQINITLSEGCWDDGIVVNNTCVSPPRKQAVNISTT
jgi:hypothetical protein